MWPWPKNLFAPGDLRSPGRPESTTSWRERQLIRAGFEPEDAAAIAAGCEFDLHALIELVERGCPPGLAVRILAPLDAENTPC
jgi:hypothetical protein